MRAIQVSEFGGPEVLELHDVPEPEAANGLVPVEVSAAGINYADTHQAENSYLQPATLPLIPGAEVVGTTPEGKRVVSLLAGGGGYAEKAVVSPAATVEIPDGVSDGDALAIILQGVTAWHILRTSSKLEPGESVLVHAAAGGVGSLAVQLAKRWGAGRVIATASSPDKRRLALDLGADVAIDSNADDLAGAIEDAAGGKVDVVLEMVGGRTFDASMDALAVWGRLVTYGLASRKLPKPIDPIDLSRRSIGVIGFWLVNCFRRQGMFSEPATELLRMVAAGELGPVVGGTYPLADARRAHEDLRERRSVGKLVLDPKA